MAKLSSKQRNDLPASDFSGPDRSYLIENSSHARNALARAAQHASTSEKASIKAKVRRRYPNIKVEGEPAKKRNDHASRRQ